MQIELVLPATIASEAFFIELKERFNIDVGLEIAYQDFPIKKAGRKAEAVTISFSGPDEDLYLGLIEDNLDDFLEANGLFY
jgi:hypothetical protein